MMSVKQEAHHGDVTLAVDVHDGLVEYVLIIDRTQLIDVGKLRISEQQARDARLCFADLFPYTEAHDPARRSPYFISPVVIRNSEILGYDNGVPILELNLPEKPCGCGVLLGEVCDCVWPGPPSVWGQTR